MRRHACVHRQSQSDAWTGTHAGRQDQLPSHLARAQQQRIPLRDCCVHKHHGCVNDVVLGSALLQLLLLRALLLLLLRCLLVVVLLLRRHLLLL